MSPNKSINKSPQKIKKHMRFVNDMQIIFDGIVDDAKNFHYTKLDELEKEQVKFDKNVEELKNI